MIIRNYRELATSPLRRTALDVLEAGLAALQTPDIMRRSVTLFGLGAWLRVKDVEIDLSQFPQILVVGIGKAAVAMGKTLEEILGDRITTGIILDRKPGAFRKLKSMVVSHPDPAPQNVRATEEVISLLKKADPKTLVIVLISGGGSAMLTAPYKIGVDQKSAIARKLMDSGATIQELNVVRKHLSRIKGGRLVEYVYPARVLSLILSDVTGDDLATIASGPTVKDPTTVEEARSVLRKHDLSEQIELSESPKDPKLFENVTNMILANMATAIPPMEKKAKQLGFTSRVLSTSLTGDADHVGKGLLLQLRPGEVLLATGETTVKVGGRGTGGRNQQLVLSALRHVLENQLIAAVGTDGRDNTNNAGALGDQSTLIRANKMGLDPKDFAKTYDSYTFFHKVGDGIFTGDLESNFADIVLALWGKGA